MRQPRGIEMSNIIAKRTTFDNVTIFLHEDGKLSTRNYWLTRRLPAVSMWQTFENVCTYTLEEIIQGADSRPSARQSAAIMAGNAAQRVAKAWQEVIYDRRVKH